MASTSGIQRPAFRTAVVHSATIQRHQIIAAAQNHYDQAAVKDCLAPTGHYCFDACGILSLRIAA